MADSESPKLSSEPSSFRLPTTQGWAKLLLVRQASVNGTGSRPLRLWADFGHFCKVCTIKLSHSRAHPTFNFQQRGAPPLQSGTRSFGVAEKRQSGGDDLFDGI